MYLPLQHHPVTSFLKRQFMKHLIVAAMLWPFCCTAQKATQFSHCFGKDNTTAIKKKMDKLLTKISKESGCAKDKITYKVTDSYTKFYSQPCRHLPRKIMVDACGKQTSYTHNGISGDAGQWLIGSWKKD